MRFGVTFPPGLFGVHGATELAIANPIDLTITWTFPAILDPGTTYTITQQVFEGDPRIEIRIRADVHTGGFCEHVYHRASPWDYRALHLLNGNEFSKTFAAPCDGFMDLDVSPVPYF